MKEQATPEQIRAVCHHIEQLGFACHLLSADQHTTIAVAGPAGDDLRLSLQSIPGVDRVVRVSREYKLASREAKQEDTVIRFAGTDAAIGGRNLAVIAGPCSIASREQAFAVAGQLAAAGVQFFLGNAFLPNTLSGSAPGLGREALRIFAEIRERFGLRIVTEAVDAESLELAAEWADIVAIGARNMQNFALLKRAGRLPRPILVERGPSATLIEFLMAAEYVLSEGNANVILCERGVRTFVDSKWNTLDLGIVPILRRESHLPVLVDPSHGTSRSDCVTPMARAAVSAGADGIVVAVSATGQVVPAGGPQPLNATQFTELMDELEKIAPVVGRNLDRKVVSPA